MSTKSTPEVFAERVVGVAHANGVYRITLAQQDESDQLRPVARLLIPESQAESMLQGIAAEMCGDSEQDRARRCRDCAGAGR